MAEVTAPARVPVAIILAGAGPPYGPSLAKAPPTLVAPGVVAEERKGAPPAPAGAAIGA